MTRLLRSLIVLAALAVVIAVPTTAGAAEAGDIDTAFGLNGEATVDFGGPDILGSVLVDDQDRILVAGQANSSNSQKSALARLLPDGSLDPTFGTGGRVVLDLGPANEHIQALALTGDNRIIAVGSSRTSFGDDFLVVRLMADGTLDPTFGGTGFVTADFGGSETAFVVTVQPDGRLLVAGGSILARFNVDGTLDTTFGVNGRADVGSLFNLRGVHVLQDDSLLVGGGVQPDEFAIGRVTSTGFLDPTFATNGIASSNFAGRVSARAFAVQADGKVVMSGTETPNPFNIDFAVVRFDTDGTLDASFNGTGMTTTNFGVGDFGTGLVIQADGMIVVGGTIATSFTGSADIGIARYQVDGALDPDFGVGGQVLVNLGRFEFPEKLALQANGKILVAGHAASSVGRQDADFQVVRFLASGDDIPPTVVGSPDRAPNSAGWYNAPVTIDWQADDNSGTASDPPDTLAAIEGAEVAYVSDESCDPSGNCAAGELALSIDLTGPIVDCSVASFVLNKPSATVVATVTDDLSGAVAPLVSAPADTSIPGESIVNIDGTDLAGNVTSVACAYTVSYQFEGFFTPIENPPVRNQARAGRTIPVKWRITDYYGDPVDDPTSFISITSGGTSCSSTDPVDSVEDYSGGSGLRNLGDGNWRFNWDTPKAYAGQCRVMYLNLADGDAARIAEFDFGD